MIPDPLDADAGGYAHPEPVRPLTLVAPVDREQLPRREAFKAAHPDVIIGPAGFGHWQAVLPQPSSGKLVITRYKLRELLDVLDEVFPPGPVPDG